MSKWICDACDEPNGATRTRCNNCDKPKPEKAQAIPTWEVVGGGDKGGILVRTGQDTGSSQESERLSTHAVIEEQAFENGRLHYKLMSGFGPDSGWVSVQLGAKVLVKRLTGGPAPAAAGSAPAVVEKTQDQIDNEDEEWKAWSLGKTTVTDGDHDESVQEISAKKIMAAKGFPYDVLGLAPGAAPANIRRAYHMLALLHHPDKGGDTAVFKTIADAYKSLSDAKDQETGGWRDLEGQAVGPFVAHPDMGTKGVTAMLFDTFGAPPWESRRLYTGDYLSATVKCWELSKSCEPGVAKPPRLVGEIAVGGFVNDLVATSSFGLITAQSAGMKPLPGESLRAWNLKQTPFKPLNRSLKAIEGQAAQAALGNGSAGQSAAPKGSDQIVLKADHTGEGYEGDGFAMEREEQRDHYLLKSEMIYAHYRGVRAISLWPKPSSRESVPVYCATVSKDVLALSKIRSDGVGLVKCGALCSVADPHHMSDVNCLLHDSVDRVWTGDNDGIMKCWDVTRSNTMKDALIDLKTTCGWISSMVMWQDAGCLAAAHSSGICFVDMRAGKVIRQQYTSRPVSKVTYLNKDSPMFFAGVGEDLNQYDTRKWVDGIDYKPKVVGQWNLNSLITSMSSVETSKGHLLVAVGMLNGKVAAFDTT